MDKLKAENNNENHENNLFIVRLKVVENILTIDNNLKNDQINQLTLDKNSLASDLENLLSKYELAKTEY
jgi:hypothetical protein